MNTALYATSSAPTDTYYTSINVARAGHLAPSLRPRSAAGRSQRRPGARLRPPAGVDITGHGRSESVRRIVPGDGDTWRRGLLQNNKQARALAAALARRRDIQNYTRHGAVRPRARPGKAPDARDRRGFGGAVEAAPPDWGSETVALRERPRTAPNPRLHSCAGSVAWSRVRPPALGAAKVDLKAVGERDWRPGRTPPPRKRVPDAYFATHGGAKPQRAQRRPKSAPPLRIRAAVSHGATRHGGRSVFTVSQRDAIERTNALYTNHGPRAKPKTYGTNLKFPYSPKAHEGKILRYFLLVHAPPELDHELRGLRPDRALHEA